MVPMKALAALAALVLVGGARRPFPEALLAEETPASPLEKQARDLIVKNSKLALRAPDFGKDNAWLNVSRPLSLRDDLAGKIVLIDFWTYCCINCMHVLPDLEYLEKKYEKDPFIVVGCHSAKFTNEAEASSVRQAVLRYDIAHPVVVDREFEIWNSFGIRSWPSFALIGPDGHLLAILSGEGQRSAIDALVKEALAHYMQRAGALSSKPLPLRRESLGELASELAFPGKVAVDPEGKQLYIADSNHDRIVVTGLDGRYVKAFGSGIRGFADGPASEARFRKPQGLAFRGSSLLVADTENHAIREVDVGSGVVRTVAGTGRQGHERSGTFPAREASLGSPWDLHVRGDEVLVAMAGPHQIWRLDLAKGTIGPFAGDGSERKADGSFEESAFAQPSGLAEWKGVVYVADSESSSIRSVDLERKTVGTVVGGNPAPANLFHFGDEDGKGLGRRLQHPLGVAALDGVLYVADTYNHKVKAIDLGSLDAGQGDVRTFAGTGKPGRLDGPCGEASFHEPGGIAARAGKLYVADTNNHRIRVVDIASRSVATLELKGVPIPMAAAAAPGKEAAGGEPLSEPPGTVRPPGVEARLAPGPARLRIAIILPSGEKLAADAPSQFRVIPLEGTVAPDARGGSIHSTEVDVPLRATEGKGKLLVQAHYYYCANDATCSVRTVSWTVNVSVAQGEKDELVLEDRPSPAAR
jgi:DNA-binding beta-propeller fold protein YncE